jgi:hypothetical protein
VTLKDMVWRIHFTPDDLERVQVSPTLGPLAVAEIMSEQVCDSLAAPPPRGTRLGPLGSLFCRNTGARPAADNLRCSLRLHDD